VSEQRSESPSCGQPMRGLYGATTICARPAGHVGKHDPIWNHKDWPEASSAAYTVGDRVRFWEEAPDGDDLTFEGTVIRVQPGYPPGPDLLSLATPMGGRDRLSDDVELVSRG
jgi:hypothetical protein